MAVELVPAVEAGGVGFSCSGYCSVSRFLNMALKVTPKPATGFWNQAPSLGIRRPFPSFRH